MNITLIKIKNDETTIKYTENHGSKKQKETVFKSSEETMEEWINCLQVLKPYALEILELKNSDYDYNLKVMSITIKHEEDYGIGIVISLQKELAMSYTPFCFNTPYIPPLRNENQECYLTVELENIVFDLMEKAKKFIKGEYNNQIDFNNLLEQKIS